MLLFVLMCMFVCSPPPPSPPGFFCLDSVILDLLEADFWDVPFIAAAQQEEERIH